MKLIRAWLLTGAGAVAAALALRWLSMPKSRIFDRVRRTDISGKKRTESSFAYLNRSGRRGSAESRALMETWLSRTPASEHTDFCARFRSGDERLFTSALQEITLHELLLRQGCTLRFHPKVAGTTKQPDFNVEQPNGPEFLLEACTSTEIASGPSGGTRADRVRDFLESLDLTGHLIAIDEFVEGTKDLSQKTLAKHIEDGIRAVVPGYCEESISIPPITTADGWRIELTAFPKARYGARRSTVMQEAWVRTWTGPSYPLRDSLKKKGAATGTSSRCRMSLQ